MPYDSSGNFSLVPGTIVSDGMTIQPSQHNPPFQDVAGGLSMVVVRDGRAPLTGNLNLNGFKVIGSGNATQPNDLVNLGQVSSAIYQIGDFKDTARILDSNWLRRDGAYYDIVDYPALAALMPQIPSGVVWTAKINGISSAAYGIVKTSLGYFSTHISGSNTLINFSTTGASWSQSSTISDIQPTRGKSLAFGNNRLVCVGTGTSGVQTSYTTDGVNWQPLVSIGGAGVPEGNVVFGANKFVLSWRASSDNAFGLLYSADATSWDFSVSYGPSTPVRGVSFINNMFVAYCSNGKILTSSTGLTWEEIDEMPSSFGIRCAEFYNGMYIFAGDSGVCYKSTDLNTFTLVDLGTTSSIYTACAYNGGIYLGGSGGVGFVIDGNGIDIAEADIPVSSDVNGSVFAGGDQGADIFVVGPPNGQYQYGIISSTKFSVPDDDPEYGWIKAL